MRKSYWVVCLLVIGLAHNTIGYAASSTMPPLKGLKIGTSTIGGAYYVVGSALGKVLEKELKIPVIVSVTQGAPENVRLLRRNEIDIGFVAGQVLYPAYQGLGGWDKNLELRALMIPYRNESVFVALKSSGLSRLTDLKGKRVGLGLDRAMGGPGNGQIMAAHGFPWEGDKWQPKFTTFKEVYGGFEHSHTMLGDGLIDAISSIITAGRPLPALSNLMSSRKLVALKYDEEALKRLEAELPYMKRAVLPAGSVPGLFEEDFLALDVGGGPCLTVRANMDEQVAYQISRIIHNNLEKLAKESIFLKKPYQDPTLLVRNYGIPFHPGALRFWKEVGLLK